MEIQKTMLASMEAHQAKMDADQAGFVNVEWKATQNTPNKQKLCNAE
jgi:hypothetical protein